MLKKILYLMIGRRRLNKAKAIFIAVLITAITGLHYLTSMSNAPLHEFYRELYFIPALLAGLWGGKRIGLTASLIISLLFLPHVVHTMGTTYSALLVNISEIMLFNLSGMLAGVYGDAKQGYLTTRKLPYVPSEVNKRFLLLIDGTPFSLNAANYLVQIFGKARDVAVTLMWVFTPQDTDFFDSSEMASSHNGEEYRREEKILEQAREILMGGGIAEARIQVKILTGDNKTRTFDKILEEVRKGDYDTVVVGKRPMNKKQEFLFGSTTISLVREAPISVIAVKNPSDEGDPEKEDGDIVSPEKST